MKNDFRPSQLRPLVALLSVLFAPAALAQGVASERELAPVAVSGSRSPLDPNLPASTFSTTRESLRTQSYLNTEDALTYAPATTVRKRFIGDRNSNLGGRSFGTLQPARGLAYVDGYLISNFLGRFDAPRWSSVAPEEVSRVDVLYGPFSAIYPGNSIGTTVAITTRNPSKFEASGGVQYYRQNYDQYGLKGTYNNDQESAFVGNRWGDLALSVGLNRMAYESHPMTYTTMTAGAVGTNLGAVSGAVVDRDANGATRVVMGASGMQTGVQEQAKIKFAYDLTSTLQADGLYTRWRNDYRVKNQTLLHSASSGAEVWKGAGNGYVNVNGINYQLPTMAPQKGLEEHEQIGGRLRTRNKTGWNYSLQLSSYQVLTNSTRQSNVSDPLAAAVVAGTDTDGAGTGWRTFELQSTYTPLAGAGHALTFGYHQNNYNLKNQVFNLSNWNSAATRTTQSQNYYGKTEVKALYAQDAWRFRPDWTATFGLRLERFRAYEGSQYDVAAALTPQINHADRTASGISPKFSLAHNLNDDWLLRASLGRGVRFPTVSELFQGTRNGTSIYNNDPNMKPEKSDAKELSMIREVGNSNLRVSLFEDDIKDAIFQQSQLVGAVTVNTVQNVARVRTRGVEAAFQGTDLLINGLDLQGSITLANSKTLENPALRASEGKNWPRVPQVRASALASYRTGLWTGSLGIKHEGRQYNTLDNTDSNPDTYGGVSSFTVANAKLSYSLGKQGSIALGVDNLTDKRYFVAHPYPGRTVFAEARLSY